MNLINTIESMKKVFLFVAAVLLCLACNEAGRTVSVTVSYATSLERSGEMVEVSMGEVSSKLHLPDTAQITADCLRPCFDSFFAVIPCVIGLRKVFHEIFYPVGVLQAKFNDFFFMGGVLVDNRKILIHPKAHACDKHHPQRNQRLSDKGIAGLKCRHH